MTRCAPYLLIGLLACMGNARAALVSYGFDSVFTGTAPVGVSPWLTATFTDIVDGVRLDVSASGLSGSENVKGFYFNLLSSLNPAQLQFSFVSGQAASVSLGENDFKADGDGRYDILMAYGTGNDGLMSGQTSSYFISGIASLAAQSFVAFSSPGGGNGTFYAAAHVQNTGSGDFSGWVRPSGYTTQPITAAPLPAALTLMLAGVGVLGVFGRNVRAR